MKRQAVISDIHANAVALRAVLEKAEAESAGPLWCLGDVVGYGPHPAETIEHIQEVCKNRVIMGNHDKGLGGEDPHYTIWFNEVARQALSWQQDQVTDSQRAWLRGLPLRRIENDVLYCHGSPFSTEQYLIGEADFRDAMKALEKMDISVAFFGHTHYPGVVYTNAKGDMVLWKPQKDGDELCLKDRGVCLVNPGSVGQPRDGNPDAGFVLFDPSSRQVTFRRVPYDTEKVRDHIINAGLPVTLGNRLLEGR